MGQLLSLDRYALTDMRKLANRMKFGVPEESSLGKFVLSVVSSVFSPRVCVSVSISSICCTY